MISKKSQTDSLISEIQTWDGKSSDSISEIYYRYYQDTSFIKQLIASIKVIELQKGSTWLLKKYLEEKGELKAGEINKVYTLLPQLEHWEAKLHILQSISYMPIKTHLKKGVEAFLRKCVSDHNKFVRAWAYSGLHELASEHREYRDEVKTLLEEALQNESASVKARVRNAMKGQCW